MRDFDVGRRFGFIFIARNSLLHLSSAEDLVATFGAVRRHLAPGGVFAFDVFNPDVTLGRLTRLRAVGRCAEERRRIGMSATIETVTLTLRNIEVGPVLQQSRSAPTESDPARTVLRATRDYRVTFSAESPGINATFVVHIGWDAKGAESCPVEQLEEVGQSLVREFAARIA